MDLSEPPSSDCRATVRKVVVSGKATDLNTSVRQVNRNPNDAVFVRRIYMVSTKQEIPAVLERIPGLVRFFAIYRDS